MNVLDAAFFLSGVHSKGVEKGAILSFLDKEDKDNGCI
jgi:hypothetical protein